MASAWIYLAGHLSIRRVGDNTIRLCRMKGPGEKDRFVNVPVKIVRSALDNMDILDRNKYVDKTKATGGWKLSVCTFKNVEYICFTFFDEHFNHVG